MKEEEEGKKGRERRVLEAHKGFVINASATIKTKTLKGEKTCFCVKQLVLQH